MSGRKESPDPAAVAVSRNESKEAEINAKIKAIREKNAARERRHAEVEADKKLAEESHSAVLISANKSFDEEDGKFQSPFGESAPANRRSSAGTSGVKSRLGPITDGRTPPQQKYGPTNRLSEKDAPPPDPGYNFLADRMRDAGSDEDENSRPNYDRQPSRRSERPQRDSRPSPRQDFRGSSGPGSGRVPQRPERRSGPPHLQQRPIEDGGRVLAQIRDIRRESSAQSRLNRRSEEPPKSSAQSRLDRSKPTVKPSRSFTNEEAERSPDPWHCPDPGCGFQNPAHSSQCRQCKMTWFSAQNLISIQNKMPVKEEVKPFEQLDEERKVQRVKPQEKSESSWASDTPAARPASSNWQAMPVPTQEWTSQPTMPTPETSGVVIGHWEPEQPATQPQHQDTWLANSWGEGSAGSDWAEEVMSEIPDVSHQQMQWMTPQNYAMPPPVQHSADPYMQPYDMQMIMHPPVHQDFMAQPSHGIPPLHQISPQQVHNVAAALTQMTHATPHNVPIMATHSNEYTPRYTPSYYQPNRYYGDDRRQSYPKNGHSYKPRETPPYRDREITKIPSRFQKQSTKAPNTYSQRKAIKERNLPKADTSDAPASARRLTIFGTSNVVNNLDEAALSKDLGVPVRLIPAMKLEVFQEKIELVDPMLDRFVLIHGLGNDARNIALKASTKSDVEKGAESDEMASEFSEIVKDLLDRIPYLSVAISTLLPRFDAEDQLAMSCPNNVRKVMNVEISSRLHNVKNVTFINNDLVLQWWDDDVKKMRLFGADGYHLTAYGFSVMLDQWMQSLRQVVTDAALPPSPDDDDSHEDAFPLEEVTKKLEDVKVGDKENEAVKDDPVEEFHDAKEDVVDPTDVPLEDSSLEETDEADKEDFREKENEEMMEKELIK